MSTNWDLLIENHFKNKQKGSSTLSLNTLMESINEVMTEVGALKGPKLDLRTPLNEEKQVKEYPRQRFIGEDCRTGQILFHRLWSNLYKEH